MNGGFRGPARDARRYRLAGLCAEQTESSPDGDVFGIKAGSNVDRVAVRVIDGCLDGRVGDGRDGTRSSQSVPSGKAEEGCDKNG